VTPEVEGVRETLKALKAIQPKLQTATRKRMRQAVAPLQNRARSKIASNPLSGWTSGRYAFDAGSARAGVKVAVGGRASSRKSSWPLVTMTQKDAGGAVFDMAGRRSSGSTPQGAAFIRGLNRHGRASRSMYAAVDDGGLEDVQKGVLDAIADAEKTVNAELKR